MSEASESVGRSSIEAGAGRPFRFSLVFEGGNGSLLSWRGGGWSLLRGSVEVSFFAALGGLLFLMQESPSVAPEVFLLAGAGVGAVTAAFNLRARRVLFQRREGTWMWRERWNPSRSRWSAITEEVPLRLEREFLTSVEGFTLYAGTARLFSYLGDPSIGRSVGLAFQAAGVPLRTVVKRTPVEE